MTPDGHFPASQCCLSLDRERQNPCVFPEQGDHGQVGQTKTDFMEPLPGRAERMPPAARPVPSAGTGRTEGMNVQVSQSFLIVKLLLYFSFLQHFVSERKYDEELGKAARFSCDIEQLKAQIMLCGESEFCILAK